MCDKSSEASYPYNLWSPDREISWIWLGLGMQILHIKSRISGTRQYGTLLFWTITGIIAYRYIWRYFTNVDHSSGGALWIRNGRRIFLVGYLPIFPVSTLNLNSTPSNQSNGDCYHHRDGLCDEWKWNRESYKVEKPCRKLHVDKLKIDELVLFYSWLVKLEKLWFSYLLVELLLSPQRGENSTKLSPLFSAKMQPSVENSL